MSTKPQTITDKTEIKYLKVFSKDIESKDGSKFTRYFAYICNSDWSDVKRTIKDKDTGFAKDISASITLHFQKDCMAKLTLAKAKFPLKITLDNSMYFITDDKDKDKKLRTRNDGSTIKVCVLVDYITAEHFDQPKYTLDDFVND